ncbi:MULTISPECIES: cytochrome c oxidase subunit II [Actinomycetes]|uniref:cytochrome-c oxidase n=2 Tax=Williamsia marianensis TaxID=85044 RepID=A0A495K183_WILMA|nr:MULTISPECIES: cytochrome c oxidase subunit II [Actinomycetes]ETD34738.1 cytochrome C oxidase subunit II [Williamsia sp. D3]RKR94996.1 cytochrome c oxidase subunit 2 [Williamsia muralis]
MKLAHGGRPPASTKRQHRGRRIKQISATLFLGVGAMMLSSCSAEEVMRFGWPEGITPEAESMRHLWTWSVIAALVMGIIVWALTFWTVTFHRKKPGGDEFPRQTAYNVPLELTYTAIPFVIIAVLFYFTIIVQNDVEAKKSDPDVVVNVTAFQWNWKFGYRTVQLEDGSRYDGTRENPYENQRAELEEHAGEKAEQAGHNEQNAIDAERNNIREYLMYDKIETTGNSEEIPVLVLPTGKRIEFEIASNDVVHSFWVPEFLFKRDVFPFPEENHTDNRFQVSSIDREGAFVGRCAEMCGTYHSMMNFEVRAVSPEEFDRYIKFRESNPNATNAQALESIGEPATALTTKPFDTRRGTQTASN